MVNKETSVPRLEGNYLAEGAYMEAYMDHELKDCDKSGEELKTEKWG